MLKRLDIIQQNEYNISIILIGVSMVKFISTTEAAAKWGLSNRRVAILCAEGRIADTQKIGNTWMIPENAEKPTDARIKSGKYIKKDEVNQNGNTN